jgi:hypothetical protein
MEQHDLERIRFVTRYFHDLKGLQGPVPVGLLVLALGLCQRLDFLSGLLVLLVVGTGALCLSIWARVYYRRRFGEVERRRRAYFLQALVGLLFIGVVQLVLLPYGRSPLQEARANYLAWGSFLLVVWFWRRCSPLQGFYLMLAFLLLGLGAPGTPILLVVKPLATKGIAMVLCGAAWSLIGLLDHRQLVRALKPIEQFELAAAEEESP